MLLRKQQPEANFEAILRATKPFLSRGLRFCWISMRRVNSGADAAMEGSSPPQMPFKGNRRFGVGGDELSHPTEHFVRVTRKQHEIACTA